MKNFEITEEILDDHICCILDIIDEVKEGRLTVLVGANGTGKSLIRKQVNVKLVKKYNADRNMIRHVSQQMRTELRSDMGAFACIAMDSPTKPTSMASFDCIKKTMNYDIDAKKYYIILDEAEIGMSRESILGLCKYLEEKIPEWLEKTLGVMVITHSEDLAEYLVKSMDCDFFHLGYNSVNRDFDAWKNRDIIPTDFEWLDKWSGALFHRVNDRSRSIK